MLILVSTRVVRMILLFNLYPFFCGNGVFLYLRKMIVIWNGRLIVGTLMFL